MQTTIELDKVIKKELMIIDSKAATKAEILAELVERLAMQKAVTDPAAFLADVYLREAEGETGIGQGIAIPHGKSPAVQETTVAIATLENEIEWETLDGKGVKAVILFAVKDSDANTTHILLLQQIAILLANDIFIEHLKAVTSVDELFELIVNQK
ncbi:PTS sugar transporter subunit IIA [Enterococcus sp. CSURQ0835]|uniref:PTS sugar transporter subunit IIA n=1 Tax=Enterococcus sp. CSURQ0835 TaxID=2681394 RepID=UPI001357C286|nr:fructose PTS transporter subunit IIA [Enterococcus sp. CSURQ0835]